MSKKLISPGEALKPQICVKEPASMPSDTLTTLVFVDLSKQVLPDKEWDEEDSEPIDIDDPECFDPNGPDFDPDEIDYLDEPYEEPLFPFSDWEDDDTEPEPVEEEDDYEVPDEEEP